MFKLKESVRIGDNILEKGSLIRITENGGKYACVMVNVEKQPTSSVLFKIRQDIFKENIYSHYSLIDYTVVVHDENDNEIKREEITGNDENEDLGYEENPHITVVYGLENDTDLSNIQSYINSEQTSFFIKDGVIDIFENVEHGECDCLIIKINDIPAELLDIRNWILKSFPNTQTYFDYKPHITIAYIKKGTCREFIGRTVELNLTITPEDFIYSPKH